MNIPQIVENKNNYYEGNLIHYYKVIMDKSKHLKNTYHNFRHTFHVLWMCHDACMFYGESLTPRAKRNLLIAALFHDYDHTGRSGNDDINIQLAIRGLKNNIHESDVPYLSIIEELIITTEFPHKNKIMINDEDSLISILRDADLSQAFSDAWVQQVIFGLANEMNLEPMQVFRMQESFLKNLQFNSTWAKNKFTQEMINEKIEESKLFIQLYDS
jgi:hypothetical protein